MGTWELYPRRVVAFWGPDVAWGVVSLRIAENKCGPEMTVSWVLFCCERNGASNLKMRLVVVSVVWKFLQAT